ncbi:MAG: endonuclease [Bacteroidetes bacterium]|nr:endonuclease [Bacteroidota bacterium]
MKTIIFFGFLFLSIPYFHSQKVDVLFYNVENLFDTINAPDKNDEDFLPAGKKLWNTERFNEKLSHIQEVFNSLPYLGIVGLAEIENRAVLEALIDSGNKKLEIIHKESLDERGIDVALLYDPTIFSLQNTTYLRFILDRNGKADFTRDILCAEFKVKNQPLHVIVNHWPSRSGGQEATEPHRMEAARNVRIYLDSLMSQDPNSKIILMGDLNDYPENNSVQLIDTLLEPMILRTSGKYGGTNEYKGEWNILDHLFVSESLKGKRKLRIDGLGRIIEDDFLISDFKGKPVPFRTYSGKYLGGYSDHLPVTIRLKY